MPRLHGSWTPPGMVTAPLRVQQCQHTSALLGGELIPNTQPEPGPLGP